MLCTPKEHDRLRRKHRDLFQAVKDVYRSCETMEQRKGADRFADRAIYFETDVFKRMAISEHKRNQTLRKFWGEENG